MAQNNPVPKIYRAVIEDVIKNVRESFLNEGVDEQVLNELKQLWENKLQQSRAIDVIPSDVNVRVSLTYPHTSQSGSTSTSQQQSIPKQTTHQSQQSAQPVPATHIIRNPAQQVVYVSNHHPTLGHVGPMTGAAAQAAMALQNPAGRGQPRAIIQQPLVGVGVPGGQVILQTTQGAPGLYQHFPGHLTAVPQRVIYAPATAPASSTTASQSQDQKPTTRIIQVDGSSDDKEPASAKSKSKFKSKSLDEVIIQVDGPDDSDSDDDDDDEDYDNIPVTGIGEVDEAEGEGEEEEPLNSEDDVSDEEHTDLFETDNVVVCQYDKIARTRNRWKFHLKDGIMNLNSKDFVFHKANGDAEW